MASKRITEATSGGTADGTQLWIPGAKTGFSYKFSLQDLYNGGWVYDPQPWVFVSATSFKIVGLDVAYRFGKGTRLRLKQGGAYKYFVVTGASYAADTTVTVTGGADYSLANAAITDNVYSYESSPEGYPLRFAFMPTITGYAVTPTPTTYFRVDGGICIWTADLWTTESSNATTYTTTIPIPALDDEAPFWGQIANNAVRQAAPGMLKLNSGATPADIFRDGNETAWTASGNKWGRFTVVYRI